MHYYSWLLVSATLYQVLRFSVAQVSDSNIFICHTIDTVIPQTFLPWEELITVFTSSFQVVPHNKYGQMVN